MLQTMMTIMALMIFSLFAVQQQRNTYFKQQKMINHALETMLTGTAVQRLGEIGAKGFDQYIVDEAMADTPGNLASVSAFGPGKDHTAEDDLDDFHMATDTLSRRVGTGSLDVVIYTEVFYAQENNPTAISTSSTPTKFKIVTLTAHIPSVDTVPEVRLSQSFSCGGACAW